MTTAEALPDAERKRRNLRDIELEEISLVDRPANPGARVAIWKRDSCLNAATSELAAAQRLNAELRARLARGTQPMEPAAIAKRAVAGDISGLFREDIFAASEALAKRMQREDETPQQAFRRYVFTDEGRALHAAYQKAASRPIEPVEKRKQGSASSEVERRAREIVEKSSGAMSMAKARVKVADDDPDLRERWRAEPWAA